MLKLAMGERAALVLEGQRVLPARLVAAGVQYAYPGLESALREILG
jgi:NAD dependent epimerase/dehydratase family enzyme